jgi:hypothetical protein
MKIFTNVLFFTAALVFLSGCASFDEDKYEYQPLRAVLEKPISDTCYVMPVIDARSIEQIIPPDNINGDPFVIFIPLWMYSKSEVSPLSKYNYFRLDLQDMMQALVTKDLQFSGIFRGVKAVHFDDNYEKPGSLGYTLRLKIINCAWERYFTTYGLAYPGAFLWMFGFPVSYGKVSMEIEAQLVESGTPTVLAKGRFKAETSCTEYLYDQVDYMPPRAEFKLTEIFPQISSQLREFIVKSIRKD